MYVTVRPFPSSSRTEFGLWQFTFLPVGSDPEMSPGGARYRNPLVGEEPWPSGMRRTFSALIDGVRVPHHELNCKFGGVRW